MFRRSVCLLLAVAMLSGCGSSTDPAKEEAEKKQEAKNVAAMQVGLLAAALDAYKTSVGELPSTKQGLQALRTRPADLPRTKVWEGPYLDSREALLADQEGHAY